ncbi:MAG: IS30 family transposase [Pseudomonadota bacterium]
MHFEDRLAMGWSPEQIVGRMELEEVEHKPSIESIYRHVYSPEGRLAGLPRQLAQRKATRGRRRRNGQREPSIPNRISVHQRPTKAHLRAQFGHWEGDLVHDRLQRDILLTLQGRVTRLTLAHRLSSKDAALTASAILAELGALPAKARRTITHDNDGEFAAHEMVTAKTGMRAFFCDPHSPWQRGGIENANGLIRRDLHRKTGLSGYTDDDIDAVICNLNSTSRKCIGYRTPIKAFAAQLRVALET